MTAPQRRRRTSRQPDPPDAGEAARKEGETQNPETQNPERLFVIGGDADGERAALDLVTLIVARADPPASATPEEAALLRLCAAPLSVAELSAYLRLPFSVVTVLLTDLLAAGLAQARAPIVRQTVADRNLLEAVMHGLQKL